MATFPPGPTPDPADPFDPGTFALLTRSHASLVGRPLVPAGAGPGWLYRDAPFGVLAHADEDDPRFFYANRAAQAAFEYPWTDIVGLPSRLSAEPDERDDRARLLAAVERDGFIDDYRGLRVSRTGRRFWIEDATVWNLLDERGVRVGQAARFAVERPPGPRGAAAPTGPDRPARRAAERVPRGPTGGSG